MSETLGGTYAVSDMSLGCGCCGARCSWGLLACIKWVGRNASVELARRAAAAGECLPRPGMVTDKEPEQQRRWEESAQRDSRWGLGPKALVSYKTPTAVTYLSKIIIQMCSLLKVNSVKPCLLQRQNIFTSMQTCTHITLYKYTYF